MSTLLGWIKNKQHKKDPKGSCGANDGIDQKRTKSGKKGGLAELLSLDANEVRARMRKQGLSWFHGNINRKRAEMKLKSG